MSSNNSHFPGRYLKRRIVLISTLAIWLLAVGVTTIHSPKHALFGDSQCQLCITNLDHSPFIGSDSSTFSPLIKIQFSFKTISKSELPSQFAVICNRGPPAIIS